MIPLIDTLLGRVSCPLHDGQIIQNFCKRNQCMKQLCPKCISTHTDHHTNHGTKPDYQQISITVENCSKLIENQISQTEKTKLRIEQYQEQWENKKKSFEENLWETQQSAVDTVLKAFQQIRMNFKAAIDHEQTRIGIKDGNNFEHLYGIYDEQVKNLQKCKKQFKNTRGYAHLRPLVFQVLPKSQRIRKQLTQNFIQSLPMDIILLKNQAAFEKQLKKDILENINISFGNQTLIPPPQYNISRRPLSENTVHLSEGRKGPQRNQSIKTVINYGNNQNPVWNKIMMNTANSSMIRNSQPKFNPVIHQSVQKLQPSMRRSNIFGKSPSPWNTQI